MIDPEILKSLSKNAQNIYNFIETLPEKTQKELIQKKNNKKGHFECHS